MAETGQFSSIELAYNSTAKGQISTASNMGPNVFKGPTPRSLFYEGAKRVPGKYGQFLMYSLGNPGNLNVDTYYQSESPNYNGAISSRVSKNPSAGSLIKATLQGESGDIVGKGSAPYYWKDFLYCKYYGTIPNNYMITLRRFPNPVLDNFSVPRKIKSSTNYTDAGIGKPLAQAVTWWGGNTGNNLSTILGFTTGIEWDSRPQDQIKDQQAFSKGLFQDGPANLLGSVLKSMGNGVASAAQIGQAISNAAVAATDPTETLTNNIRSAGLRDRAKEGGSLLSEYIWTPVDVVKKTWVRKSGLTFVWQPINLIFEYELTSVGQVNTKAAMLDLMANLLSIGTNYGNFLTPDIRYKSSFPALGFPGGDPGLESYFNNPLDFLTNFAAEIAAISTSSGGAGDKGTDVFDKFKKELEEIKGDVGNKEKLNKFLKTWAAPSLQRALKLAVSQDLIQNYQLPISLLTGAPIGEWHLTVGNPFNPIATIGNLICKDVKIELSESLGPDDFPTGLKATFVLEHARDREKGEIESIFNRGDGRLYQSNAPASSSQQSYGSFIGPDGQQLSEETKSAMLSGSYYGNSANANTTNIIGK